MIVWWCYQSLFLLRLVSEFFQIRRKIQSKEWWSLWLRILLLLDRPCFFYLRLIFILCWLFWLGFSCLVLSLLVLTRLKTVVLDQSYAYDSMTWSISDSCWSLQLRSLLHFHCLFSVPLLKFLGTQYCLFGFSSHETSSFTIKHIDLQINRDFL